MLVDHTEISTDRGDRHIGDRDQRLQGRPIVTIVSGSVIALVRLHYCPDATASMWEVLHINMISFCNGNAFGMTDTNCIGVRLFLYTELVGQTNCRTRGILSKLSRPTTNGTAPVWALNSAGLNSRQEMGFPVPRSHNRVCVATLRPRACWRAWPCLVVTSTPYW